MNLSARHTFRKLRKALVLLRRPGPRRAMLRFGVAGALEHDAVLRSQDFTLIVDVGASRGQFSLIARHFQPAAKIIAFEPLAGAADMFQRVFEGDRLVRFHRSAVGPSRTTATMQVSGSDDSSSLLPISDLMPALYPGTQSIRTEDVPVAPLSDFLDSADLGGKSLLKIDVQGYELEVLKSAGPLLSSIGYIYVEASFLPLYEGQPLADDLIDFLQQRKFRLCGVLNTGFHPETGLPVQADMLFANADAA